MKQTKNYKKKRIITTVIIVIAIVVWVIIAKTCKTQTPPIQETTTNRNVQQWELTLEITAPEEEPAKVDEKPAEEKSQNTPKRVGRGRKKVLPDLVAEQIKIQLTEEKTVEKVAEKISILIYHLDQYDQYKDMLHRPYETLKRFFKIYIRDFDGAGELRDKLMHTSSTDEARSILARFKKVLYWCQYDNSK